MLNDEENGMGPKGDPHEDQSRLPDGQDEELHNDETEEAKDIDLHGFQYVRREFFSHIHEPSISFNDGKVGVNTACVKRLPEVNYVQILINRETKMLAIKPCEELDLYSFQWCIVKGEKRFPRQVTGRLFFMKICDLMRWNPQHRYKILGKLCRANGQYIIVFDLQSTEKYERTVTEGGKKKVSRTPVFPAEWKDQFGIPYEEHQKALQINMFDGYALYSLTDKGQIQKEEDDSPSSYEAEKTSQSGEENHNEQ